MVCLPCTGCTVAQTYQVVFGNLNFNREIFFDNPGFAVISTSLFGNTVHLSSLSSSLLRTVSSNISLNPSLFAKILF